MYFDNGAIINSQPNCFTVLNVTAQIENNPSRMLDDTLGWMRIQGVFTANGTESRITLGNFYTDANSVGLPTGVVNGRYPATYNIDDISLIATDITAYAGNDATICVTDSVYLGRPQEVGLECLWYKPNASTSFLNTSDMWFKPTQTGTYTFIQRMDNCAITWDTVTINVVQDCASLLPVKEIPNVFTPNGDGVNDVFSFTINNATNINFIVYNRWGLEVASNPSPSGRLGGAWDGRTTSGMECASGVYFYTLQYTDAKGDLIKKNGYISLIK